VNRVRVLSAVAATAVALGSLVAVAAPSQASGVATPSPFTAVTAVPGPGPGEVTFTWSHNGASTTSYVVETALSLFASGQHGRGAHTFTFPAGQSSATLTAAQTAAAGASASSANHLYYRFEAVDSTSGGTAVRWWPYQQSVAVQPDDVAATGTPIRVASYNVRSAAIHDSHTWLKRAPLVAKTIISRDPGIVTLAELGPGRADGVSGPSAGHTRQTTSLLNSLKAQGVSKYSLVRTTSYTNKTEGSQGTRILYDRSRYHLISNCPQTTNGHSYSSSCTILMPMRASDPSTTRSRAAFAEFSDIATGQKFIVVSVHLDSRHSSTASTERSLDALRGNQIATVIAAVTKINPHQLPVILAGDLNSWQYNVQGFRAHDALVKAGYYDDAAAQTQINVRYSTFNGFAKTMSLNSSGWNARLDVISAKGLTGAVQWENVMKTVDSNRASDHNMIVADLLLPGVAAS
jgi:endonuclease/exonuclease/phosphatase family metal-dependent hydrolase